MNKLEQIFVAKRQFQGLINTKNNQTEMQNSTNMQQIVNCLLAPENVSNPNILSIINSNLHYRRLYKQALHYFCDMQSIPQVAASSDNATRRSAEGFEIKWVFDESVDKQVFVVVKLDEAQVSEKVKNGLFLHAENADEFHMIYFEHTELNKYQLLTTQDSQSFSLISHPESHLYIMSR